MLGVYVFRDNSYLLTDFEIDVISDSIEHYLLKSFLESPNTFAAIRCSKGNKKWLDHVMHCRQDELCPELKNDGSIEALKQFNDFYKENCKCNTPQYYYSGILQTASRGTFVCAYGAKLNIGYVQMHAISGRKEDALKSCVSMYSLMLLVTKLLSRRDKSAEKLAEILAYKEVEEINPKTQRVLNEQVDKLLAREL